MTTWKTAHQEIANRARAGRALLTRELTLAGLLRTVAVVVLGFTLGIVLHLVVRLGTPVAWGISLALAAGLGMAAWRFVIRPLARRPDPDRFVEWLDGRHDASRNIIVSAWQIGGRDDSATRYAPDLVEAVVRRGSEAVQKVDLGHWHDRRADRRWWWGLGSAAALLVLLAAVVGPARLSGAAGKVVDPRRAAGPPVSIEVHPGDLTVERGDDVPLKIAVAGSGETPYLRVREVGGVWMSRRLDPAAAAPATPGARVEYGAMLRKVERNQEYLVAVEKTESPVWHITVNEPPRVSGFEISYYYPAYTHRALETVTSGSGDISALVGTKIELKVLTNRKMPAAWMTSGPSGAVTLDVATALDPVDQMNWVSRFTVAGDPRDYTVDLKDQAGTERFVSPRFRIDPVPDRAPVVHLVVPDKDVPIPESMSLNIEAQGVDDYGLTRLDLVYQLKDGAPGRLRLKDFAAGATELNASFVWDLVPLKLMPGNEVTYYLELFDNDTISGPKSARSEVRHLRFPTVDEIYADVQNEHQEQIDNLSSALGSSQQLKEQLEKLSREAKKGDQPSWERKKEIESLMQRQSDLEKQVDDTARQLEETLRKAQEQTLLSPELLQKMQELADLMKSIKDEKLKAAMDKLSDALQKMDPQAINKALEDFKVNQEEMMKGLDRTIDMLKEIQKEEAMEDAVRKAEELAQEQKDLSKEIDDKAKDADKKDADGQPRTPDENKPLADKQSELNKKADELAKQLEELRKMAENEAGLKKDLEDIKNSGQQQNMQENMKQSQKELQQGEREKALDFAFKAHKDAEEMAKKLRNARQNSSAAKKRELQERLLAVIQDLVDVSSAQEELLAQSPGTPEGELAARQKVLSDGTLKSALALEALGKRTLFVGKDQSSKIADAMKKMNTAIQYFVSGNRGGGLAQGKESAGDLNEAIVELMQSHSSMCSSASASGFMEQMQKMAGLSDKQKELNAAAQEAMGGQNNGKRPRMSESEGEQLERMAAQQEMIKRGLEDVAGKLGDRRDILGRLDQLSKEMGDVAEQLRQHGVDDKVLERQERILSRLLDAQKSIRKRDDDNQRESKTAEQLVRPSPGPLSRDQLMGPERLRSDILKGQSDDVPAQFRALVEQYFRALTEQKADRPIPSTAPQPGGGSR